ncbi:MAG: hypothetical protein K8L99_26055 [Anaerolineae bacterium]|nr:hypothetical protein [Anaerolineae bacterium]
MSFQHPNILYVGGQDTGRAFAQAVKKANWWVHLPTETLEALGMYITYMPDIIVIDLTEQPELTQSVYEHLQSIEASPMLVLAVDPQPGVYNAVPESTPHRLPTLIRTILDQEAEHEQLLSTEPGI